jgi:hypothetical protein
MCYYRIQLMYLGNGPNKDGKKVCWEVRNWIVSRGKFPATSDSIALCSN